MLLLLDLSLVLVLLEIYRQKAKPLKVSEAHAMSLSRLSLTEQEKMPDCLVSTEKAKKWEKPFLSFTTALHQ